MAKNAQTPVVETPAADVVDLSKLTVAELSAYLSKARAAEKELKQKAASLPMYAYLVVMDDSKLVYWSGRAESVMQAQEMAKAYATQEGGKVFDMCTRPLPQPRGRKAKGAES